MCFAICPAVEKCFPHFSIPRFSWPSGWLLEEAEEGIAQWSGCGCAEEAGEGNVLRLRNGWMCRRDGRGECAVPEEHWRRCSKLGRTTKLPFMTISIPNLCIFYLCAIPRTRPMQYQKGTFVWQYKDLMRRHRCWPWSLEECNAGGILKQDRIAIAYCFQKYHYRAAAAANSLTNVMRKILETACCQ